MERSASKKQRENVKMKNIKKKTKKEKRKRGLQGVPPETAQKNDFFF